MLHSSSRYFFFCLLFFSGSVSAQSFVQRVGTGLRRDGKAYTYIGANYWYGGLLGLHTDPARGIQRLRAELDFLAAHGVRNVRVLAGAEGEGVINGVPRVSPPLQPRRGEFTTGTLKGLDRLLAELGKRNMTAVIFLSNNWEWSGGFQQYLNWNGQLPDSILRRKLGWDEMRDIISGFYTCSPCLADYRRQADQLLNRVNTVTGKRYVNDPAIMAWELANEPRPMRPASNDAYGKWIRETAAYIKSKDRHHLVTIGHEGDVGTESMELFKEIHRDPNIDYLTIHIWPKNWGWFRDTAIRQGMTEVLAKTGDYIRRHIDAARELGKPLVIEEFGLPRDGQAFSPASATTLRDQYFVFVFSFWRASRDSGGVIAGANFWAFGGRARPHPGQVYWKKGDDYLGDPPMEEQGLNTVFDSDRSTWEVVRRVVSREW
jgi:mannan endo-1,4-beta-mannosidase